jgi:hypothetical protein
MKKLQTTFTIMFILISALLWAISPQPQQQPQVMKRESKIEPASYEEALTISLAVGDYRKVDFSKV